MRRELRVKNQLQIEKPDFDCPDFLGEFENTPSDKYCGTPYCSGASYFDPMWQGFWVTGYQCPCGCSEELYICDDPDEGWWKA